MVMVGRMCCLRRVFMCGAYACVGVDAYVHVVCSVWMRACVCVCLRVVLCVQNEAGERGRGVFAAKAAPEGAARSAKGGKAHAPSASGVLRVR